MKKQSLLSRFANLFRSKSVKRAYAAGETGGVNATRRPFNRPADQEMMAPFGADSARAYARELVRNNAYAWGVVDTIVSSVVGTGIQTMSALETQDGEDVEHVNEIRDSVWEKWCEVAELTGQFTFQEVQQIAQREIAEAGEVLIHFVTVPMDYRGIKRPVPFAIELIEADRLATDRDTYQLKSNGRRIVRGVEIDEIGMPVAYWVYPNHPSDLISLRREPVRIEASNIQHLFRRDRVGQNRGITWFAPVVRWLRDLGLYVDNEMQAGAVASCSVGAIRSDSPITGLPGDEDETESGSTPEWMEPGMMFRLKPGEDVTFFNPGRPNSGAEPWINLMLRGIAVGTGLSYEIVARDFSQTNYSSSRTSQLEDRRRFRRWQKYLIDHLCNPTWKRFCVAAAQAGRVGFPSMVQIEADFNRFAPAEFMPPSWEWVDPGVEQSSGEAAIVANQTTYSAELGSRGLNWRHIAYQRAKEEKLFQNLGLTSPAASKAALTNAQNANAQVAETNAAKANPETEQNQPAGEMAGLSTLQFKRNRKAIEAILGELQEGKTTEQKARVYLSSIGMGQASIDALITDAMDGSGKLETTEATE
jgi:lambda family phage portal protein